MMPLPYKDRTGNEYFIWNKLYLINRTHLTETRGVHHDADPPISVWSEESIPANRLGLSLYCVKNLIYTEPRKSHVKYRSVDFGAKIEALRHAEPDQT